MLTGTKKGQPASERVSIGKHDPETGLLIPNTRYCELFEKRAPLPMPEYVRDYGVYAAFRVVVEEPGLDKLIRKHFHEISRMENELSEMDEPPAGSLHYDRYFFITRSSRDGALSIRRNTAAIDKTLSQCGFCGS